MGEIKKAITPLAIFLLGVLSIVFGVLWVENAKFSTLAAHPTLWNTLLIFSVTLLAALSYVFFVFHKEKTYKICVLTLGTALLTFAFLYAYAKISQKVNFSSVEDLRAFISAKGSGAVWVFIGVQFAQVTLIPIPSTITTGVGYALFGLWKGTLYAFIGSMLGSLLAFAIGKLFGYQAVKWIVGKETLDHWLDKIKGKDKLILTFMFIMPFFPDDVLCMVAGLSSMSTAFFTLMIIPVRLVTIFFTCLTLGGNLIPFHSWGIAVWGVIILGVILLAVLLWKKGTKLQEVLLGWFKKGKRDDE